MSASINQSILMTHSTMEGIKSNFKDITHKYGPNKYQNNKNIECCDSMNCASIICISMLIVEVICHLFYTLMDHLSIRKHTLIYLFTNVIIIIIAFNGMNLKCRMTGLMEQFEMLKLIQ